LTQLVDAASDGDQWLHEIKYDGYRLHARLDRAVAICSSEASSISCKSEPMAARAGRSGAACGPYPQSSRKALRSPIPRSG
jgi:hypothetical protein